jgi:hypothetical protein
LVKDLNEERKTKKRKIKRNKTVSHYNETNVMHFLFNLLRIKASTCLEHYLLILWRRNTSGTWYIAFVLCQLAAPGFNFNPGAAN